MKKHNFSAGPSILNQKVFKESSKAVLELDNIGLSLLEISHRSLEFVSIHFLVLVNKETLRIPRKYQEKPTKFHEQVRRT